MSNFNPYHAPTAALPTGKYVGNQGMWREGKLLLMTKGMEFPDRCIKCNEPANGYRLKRDLSWHSPAFYLLIFFPGILIYIIVAMIVRKTAKLQIPLCPRHRAARRRDLAIGWLGSLGGIAIFISAFVLVDSLPQEALVVTAISGLVVIFSSMIYGSYRCRVVVPKRIDETMVWLKNVSPDFLGSLPDAAAPAGYPWIESENPKKDALEVVEDFREV